MANSNEKTRYSDMELQEFKEIILEKLRVAKEELSALTKTLNSSNGNGTDDTAGTFKTLEDGSATLGSEEHTSELQSLMRNSYAVLCLKKKKERDNDQHITTLNN